MNEILKTREKVKRDYPLYYEEKCKVYESLNIQCWRSENYPNSNLLDPLIDLSGRGFINLLEEHFELAECYSYSLAADVIAKKYSSIGDNKYSGYWIYQVRNYHFNMFIPRFDYLLEHSAFFINEIFKCKFVKDNKEGEPTKTNYKKVLNGIKKCMDEIDDKISSIDDNYKKALHALESYLKNITDQGREILKRYRNISTHRYLIGIDYMSGDVERTDSKTRARSNYGRLFSINGYTYYGKAEFNFVELLSLSKQLIMNSDIALKEMSKIFVIEKAFKKDE